MQGGAFNVDVDDAKLSEVVVISCKAETSCHAFYLRSVSSSEMDQFLVGENGFTKSIAGTVQARIGGGAVTLSNANCSDNYKTEKHGGFYFDHAEVSIQHAVITRNYGPGIIHAASCSLEIDTCTIWSNFAGLDPLITSSGNYLKVSRTGFFRNDADSLIGFSEDTKAVFSKCYADVSKKLIAETGNYKCVGYKKVEELTYVPIATPDIEKCFALGITPSASASPSMSPSRSPKATQSPTQSPIATRSVSNPFTAMPQWELEEMKFGRFALLGLSLLVMLMFMLVNLKKPAPPTQEVRIAKL